MRTLHLVAAVLLLAVINGLPFGEPVVLLQESSQAHMSQGAAMRALDENVDKDLWLARQAQESAAAEDLEIERLLAMLEGLDDERDAAEKEAKQREVEAKEATAAKLKETAKQKYEVAHHAIEYKFKVVEEGALKAQKDAETLIEQTKTLQATSAAQMSKAKVASEEYQNALTAGVSDNVAALQMAAEKAMRAAQEAAAAAGSTSQNAKIALQHAAEVKARADKALRLEKESRADLVDSGLRWVAGPIFDKMKTLCERDYPTFKQEYRKIRQSATYKGFRWDIKQACKKARTDDLENEEDIVKLPVPPTNPHSPPLGPDAYPKSHTHWAVPKGGKVAKWCTTQYGAVPCGMLKKAKEAGLLGDIGVDDKSLAMIELMETEDARPSGAETAFAEGGNNPTSNFPGPPHGLAGYKESHNWESDVDLFSPVVFNLKYFNTMFGDKANSPAQAKRKWAAHLESDKKVPYCEQASPQFSLNTYYRAHAAALKEQTSDGVCGQVLKQYLTTGLFQGASTYSADAEASFKASTSQEELSKMQGNHHAQKVRLESTSLESQPNCDVGHIADSTKEYAWSFFYKPVSTEGSTRNIMTYGDSGSVSTKKQPFGSAENGPAVFERQGAEGNRLQFKVSMSNNNEWSCSPSEPLSYSVSDTKWHLVSFNVNHDGVTVFYNGKQVDSCQNANGHPTVFKNRRLHLATSSEHRWKSSRSFIKGLTYYPGTQLSAELIQAEMQQQNMQAALAKLRLEESLLAKASSASLGEARTGVAELAGDIDSKLNVHLPEEQEDTQLASDIDSKLGTQNSGRVQAKSEGKIVSVEALANSIDSMLWSGHATRTARAKAGSKLQALQDASDQVTSLADDSSALASEMKSLNTKVKKAQEIVNGKQNKKAKKKKKKATQGK